MGRQVLGSQYFPLHLGFRMLHQMGWHLHLHLHHPHPGTSMPSGALSGEILDSI
jgi:hypothetical protein